MTEPPVAFITGSSRELVQASQGASVRQDLR